MFQKRLLSAIAALVVLMSAVSIPARAQGVTTGAIAGTVTDHTATGGGNPVESAQIQVRNNRTGFTAGTLTRSTGQYVIQGLEPDDSYSITVRRIGFQPVTRNNLRVGLGQTDREDFALVPQTNLLSAVKVTGEADAVINPSKIGTGMQFNDSALHRLPTLNRNFADFVSLVPQVSTTTAGLSGGGVNIRQNAIQIDGAAAGDLFGLGTTGQPGSQANGKSIPLDAVKEYQVLLSPFDVRQGNFGGMLINAVTKSGTNEFHGSAYGYERGQNLTRKQTYLQEFYQRNYGFTLSGPIIPNRLFFFVNPEWQKYHTPTNGPDASQPICQAGGTGTQCMYIAQSSIDQLNNVLSSKYGFSDAGNGGKILQENPLLNVFGRIDAYLPFNTRAVLRHNYAKADNTNFGRSLATSASPIFNLTSNKYFFSSKTNSSVAEFFTNLPRGFYNELSVNYTNTHDFRTVPVNFPMIDVRGIPRTDVTTPATFRFGTENSSQGNALDQRTLEVTENLTFPIGAHTITVGGKDLVYKWVNLFGQNRLGYWFFNSLDSLANGIPAEYRTSAPSPTDPAQGLAVARAHLYSGYVQDVWTATPRFTLSYGVRVDRPNFIDRPPFNQSVWDVYARSTSSVPGRPLISPRVGINWDVTGDQRNQIRGGIGYYTGVPPFVYLSNAYGNSGLSGFAALTCANTSNSTHTPAFNAANIATPPTSCADFTANGVTTKGASTALSSSINTIDPNFRFPQYQKWNLAYDHRFASGLVSTIEGLLTRSIANPYYSNLALAGIQGVGAHGRILYGNQTGTGASPVFRGNRTTVLDVSDTHGDYTYSITGQLQKTFFERFQSSLAYTYSQSRDVGTITSSTAGSNFRFQRDLYGSLDDRTRTRSKNDQPHKIIGTGSWHFKTLTDVSMIYQGNSGSPYDYVYGTGSGTGSGDINGDGQTANDLFYVPTDAHDPNEILFTGYNGNAAAQASAAAQADAFEAFIKKTACLRNQRGQIMNRNTCRNPWQNEFDLTVGQSLQAFGRQNLQLRLDILNFGNLLNRKWGEQLYSNQGSTCGANCSATILVTQTGNKLGSSPAQAVPVVTFDTNLRRFSGLNASSNYRMQLSLRYSF
ncbi:MAG: carboxypeptidase regulatory-like domain-containing protein [Gemmatimonadota bacterium]|nr:carboxypeptidase regulatory-like domain-containing protein [Gemmatimonadota bacterium]